MLEKNIIKIIEIFTLGFVFPILVVYFSLSNYILIFLWIIFLYTFIIFIRLYKEPNLFKNAFNLIQLRKYFFFYYSTMVFCFNCTLLLYKISFSRKAIFTSEK